MCWTSQHLFICLLTLCTLIVILTSVSFSIQIFWDMAPCRWVSEPRSTSPGTTRPTTHRHIPKDLNVPIQMLWRQVYKYSDTAKWSGTATRLKIWNCSTTIWILYCHYTSDGALRFHQCRCCCSVGERTVKRVRGSTCNVAASRMHNLSRSTKRASLVVWWIGSETANLIIRS